MKIIENNIVGDRLKSARMQLNFSRRKFADICGFSAATLQAWEDGKYPVPIKSIVKYVEALYSCGLITTPEWFIKGEGLPPRPINISTCQINSKKETILREINFFERENSNAIITTIHDDAMMPYYAKNDFVGGILVSVEQAEKYLGAICIITIDSGETLVRKLKPGSEASCYNLISSNLDTNVPSAFLLNCKIQQLAQVIWHRKIGKD